VSESSGLALVFRHEGDHVTTLLAAEGQQLGMGPEVGLAALQLHRSAACFATRRQQRRCRK
jgi:hypothetical protein